MRQELQTALATVDALPSQKVGIAGDWTLAASPHLTNEMLTALARQTGWFDTYGQFLKRFNSNPVKPIAPDENDPTFDPPRVQYDHPLDKALAKRIRYDKALTAYNEQHSAYQAEALKNHELRAKFGQTPQGYLSYARAEIAQRAEAKNQPETVAEFDEFLNQPRPLPIAEKVASLGCNVIGNHGSGKSEIFKHRIWHYLTKPDPHETIVVIDPHGEMALEVARMKPNRDSGRLVFFDPLLDPDFMPCMSVLRTHDKHPWNLRREAEAYGSALEMLSGGEMSDNMKSLCQRSAHILLENDQFDLMDLMELLETEPAKKGQDQHSYPTIYRYAAEHSTNRIIRRFFQGNFLYGNFSQAKNGLGERITRILESPIAQEMFLNPPTLDFGELVNQGKVIVIRLPMGDLGDEVTDMVGQMIVAQIQLAVRKRDPAKFAQYPQVHLFMDEAHHFVSQETAKQVDELRKFRMSVNLATQYIDKYPPKILDSVKGMGVQIAGLCVGGNLTEMNEVFGLRRRSGKDSDVDEATILANQSVGQFYFKSRKTEPDTEVKTRQFRTDTSLLFNEEKWQRQNAERYMTEEEWEQCKADQLSRYYRRVGGSESLEAASGPIREEPWPSGEPKPELGDLTPKRGYDD